MSTLKAAIEATGVAEGLAVEAQRLPFRKVREMLGSIRARTAGQGSRARAPRQKGAQVFQWNWLGRCGPGNGRTGALRMEAPRHCPFLGMGSGTRQATEGFRTIRQARQPKGGRANRKAATSPWSPYRTLLPLARTRPHSTPGLGQSHPCSRNPLRVHHSRVAIDTAMLAEPDCRGHHPRRKLCQLGRVECASPWGRQRGSRWIRESWWRQNRARPHGNSVILCLLSRGFAWRAGAK
jgi:hypothetical protein